MSPLDYIEDGIIQGRWDRVCEGYKLLTGKSLPTPKVNEFFETISVEDALSKIARIVSNTSLQPAEETSSKKKKPGRPKGKKKKSSKSKPVSADGEDDSLQLAETGRTTEQKEVGNVQLITNEPDPEEVARNKVKAAKSARNKQTLRRPVVKSYDVECSECQSTFKSDRPGGEMGQKCNKCLMDKKSRFV
jgi:hypothetical protein